MFVSNLATLVLAKSHLLAFWLFQNEADASGVGWDPISLWKQMGWLARIVVIILFIMSAWSIGVMIDRYIAFNAARKQSRSFAPQVAGALRDGKIDEAIRVAERNQKSRPKFVHQPALKWNQPGFEQNKNCDGDLDDCRLHFEVILERLDEQGPAILIIRDCDHADDARSEDNPAIGYPRFGKRSCRCGH